MNSADKIKRLFEKAELGINPDADEKIFRDMFQARQNTTKKAPAMPGIWRITMRSPITKLAIAAVITIACVTGVLMLRETSGIALADVLNRIEQVKAVRYKWNFTLSIYTGSEKTYNHEIRGTSLNSGEYGTKSNWEWLDSNGGDGVESIFLEKYLLPQKKLNITINHMQKTYSRHALRDVRVEPMQKEDPDIKDPLAFIRRILKTKYESLGKSTIDGTEVTVFQTKDPNFFTWELSELKEPQADVKLWVDVETLLPVRIDNLASYQIGDDRRRRMVEHTVMYDFQWNIPVDASEFEPVIPDDYTVATAPKLKRPAPTEENAIKGLRLYVDLSGNYPKHANMLSEFQWSAFEKTQTPAAKRLQEEIKDLTEKEKANRLKEALLPLQGISVFYISLIRNEKDAAYYGNTVTTKDTDKVLMRWKVSENEYRVIFGDLKAETVDADVLTELESALPK